MRQIRRVATVALAACLALSASACADDSGTKPSELSDSTSTSASAPTTDSSAASSSSSAPTEEDAVIAAYKGFFETFVTLGEVSDSTAIRQAIAPYGAGVAADRAVQVIEYLKSQSQEPGGSVTFSEIVVQVDGQQATTNECRDGTSEVIVDSTTKQELSHGDPNTLFTATMSKDDMAVWRVIDYDAVAGAC